MEELRTRRKKLLRDGILILISILFAYIIHQFDYLERLIEFASGPYFFAAAFVAGIFFSSTFTVAIATSVFLLLGETHAPLGIALIGALGAILGDTFIFKFLKDDLIADFDYLENQFGGGKRIAKRIFHSKLILWFAPIVAAIMIASPIPDEIGLILLAGIKLKYRQFFLISLILNFIGILVIGLFAKNF